MVSVVEPVEVSKDPLILSTKMPERKTACGLRYTRKIELNIRIITRELVHYKGAPDQYRDEFDNLSVEQLHKLLKLLMLNHNSILPKYQVIAPDFVKKIHCRQSQECM